ncbi:sugar ABC transporter permease [Nocardioides panacis]|uniref:Sugar ABC transporter permease n=2 Tax=Nocardioides panacis TaxID=2849501 RepID=A0A975Y2E1_9ACTN|nr:sugar ABC transporter permease [Nocardioides panacis]
MWATVLIAPTAIGLLVFSIWPTLLTFYYSFTSWGAFGGHTWAGLENYTQLLHDSELLQSLVNTAILSLITLLSVPLGIVVAALLHRPDFRLTRFYRTVYFLPAVTLPASIALMWRLVYNGDFGPLNWTLSLVGIDGPSWLADSHTAIYALGVVSIWGSIGYNMVLFLAGMQAIPRDYYEAAELDGAGSISQFFQITVPLLTPTTFFVTVITVINALQAFDLVFLMIGKTNPALEKSQTVVYLFYEKGFVESQGGYAAAIAFVLLAVILVFTAVQFRMQRRWVHYG